MPRPAGSLQTLRRSGLLDFWIETELYNRTISEWEVELKLKKHGLERFEVELIMAKYVDNKKLTDIVAEFKFKDLNQANYLLRKAVRKLRESGFNLK